MNLDEFFRSEIEKEDTEENDTKNKREPENSVKTEDSHNVSNNSNISRFTLMNHSHSVSSYFDEDRQLFTPELGSESTYVQRRGLPPIPNNGSKQSSPLNEREAVYEELPVAPRPPDKIDDYPYTPARKHDDEDGYMSPAQLRLLQMQEYSETSSVVKNKPPVAPRDRLTRSRRPKSEISSNFADYGEFKDNIPINIDELFNFSEERYPKPDTQYASVLKSPYRMNTQTQFDRSYVTEQNRFVDDQGLDTRPLNSLGKLKSRSHKNLNVAANVTVRSHNIRKMPNVMDVFTVNDSVRQPSKNDDSEYGFVQSPKYDQRSDFMENERGRMYPYGGFPPRGGYAESEPGLRRHSRSLSLAGINDPYAKQGDDSVLSGDYGYHGDSEYSYNEYSEWRDDGWTPPSDLSNLTVQEVSKSLRYIGMKDRVVIRLANEQIDGALLCSLDKKLLQEGFPELNALEVKKIVDFINGWRPKK
ncbi:hypothetical protein KUTeg_016950 [Tegillarca granosa]|uniref:Uncharacterized protein n=1 Tax=Tegillarca granosa TaxID=220873 RepID=A0ABQ9ESM8_TEGGR|nr:hypothetical protein KUTeg_016950 [Tegillarca granosa]